MGVLAGGRVCSARCSAVCKHGTCTDQSLCVCRLGWQGPVCNDRMPHACAASFAPSHGPPSSPSSGPSQLATTRPTRLRDPSSNAGGVAQLSARDHASTVAGAVDPTHARAHGALWDLPATRPRRHPTRKTRPTAWRRLSAYASVPCSSSTTSPHHDRRRFWLQQPTGQWPTCGSGSRRCRQLYDDSSIPLRPRTLPAAPTASQDWFGQPTMFVGRHNVRVALENGVVG